MGSAPALGPLLRGLSANRRRPDLAALARERDPERFVWRILPLVARSFAASIVVLSVDQARAAAVAYLYCRMLDTFEDLVPEPEACIAELARFAERFDSDPPPPPNGIPEALARDQADRVYLLLIARCELVDRVYARLEPEIRDQIRVLVRDMAEGMAWSTDAFARQGGVLLDEDQLARYCRNVIGHPAMFTLELVSDRELTPPDRDDALAVSEMIQLANVSRDIERDLARGIGYHPDLKPFLGRSEGSDAADVVRKVREDYLGMALGRAPAYRRLFDRLQLGETASVRTAAVMMLLFTDLHYRWCAVRTGNRSWPGPRDRLQVIAGALPSLMSPEWASGVIERVENNFAVATRALSRD